MKSIKLLKDHYQGDVLHKAGSIVEVTDQDFEYLMGVYLSERRKLVGDLKKVDSVLKRTQNDR